MRRVRIERGDGEGEARAARLSWACVGRDDILGTIFLFPPPWNPFGFLLFFSEFRFSLAYKVYPAGAAADAKHFPGWLGLKRKEVEVGCWGGGCQWENMGWRENE